MAREAGGPNSLLVGAGLFVACWLSGLAGIWGAALLLAAVGFPLAVATLRWEDPFWGRLFALIPLGGGPLRLPEAGGGDGAMRAVDAERQPRRSFHPGRLLAYPGFYGRWGVASLTLAFATGIEMLARTALLDSPLKPSPVTDRFLLAMATEAAAAAAFGVLRVACEIRERLRRRGPGEG